MLPAARVPVSEPQHLTPVNVRDYSPTRLRRKARPVLAADGRPNTCASAPKPPGVRRGSWTCGPGAWQAWARRVRDRPSDAVPPTRQLCVRAFLFQRTSPESLYINPSHHNGRPMAGGQRSPDVTTDGRVNSTRTPLYLVRKGQCGTSLIPYLVMERYSPKASRSSTGMTMVMVFFQGNLRFSRFSTNRYPAKIPT